MRLGGLCTTVTIGIGKLVNGDSKVAHLYCFLSQPSHSGYWKFLGYVFWSETQLSVVGD